MAKATLALGKFLACRYPIDEVSSFLGGCSELPLRLLATPKEAQ